MRHSPVDAEAGSLPAVGAKLESERRGLHHWFHSFECTRRMTAESFHLAHINIAHMRGGYDDPVMAEFVARLDAVNAVAEASPGFVWRFQTEDDAVLALRVFRDRFILFNMSVWESLESLRAFSYEGAHLDVLRDRHRWFEKPGRAHLALWWIPVGCRPALEEGRDRLLLIDRLGATADAFTFQQPFPFPAVPDGRPIAPL